MALTTPTAMACRTDAPADKAAVVPVAVPVAEALVAGPAVTAEVLAVAYPRAVVASTRRHGKCPVSALRAPAQSPAHTLDLY
jgi:hypothetical protein